jgi:hypothetical protein
LPARFILCVALSADHLFIRPQGALSHEFFFWAMTALVMPIALKPANSNDLALAASQALGKTRIGGA